MDSNKFYVHVSSWIKSYRNADALQRMRGFINNSTQSHEIKQALHYEIDRKMAGLKQQPAFVKRNGDLLLADDEGHPRIFTTRFSAVCKVAELKLNGYNVELYPRSVFYRIKLLQPAPIDEYILSPECITMKNISCSFS